MIADLNAVSAFQIETESAPATTANKRTVLVSASNRIKKISAWINPKNWFNRFASIEIDMSEFACKKSLPKE
jgi:hypothetical protein